MWRWWEPEELSIEALASVDVDSSLSRARSRSPDCSIVPQLIRSHHIWPIAVQGTELLTHSLAPPRWEAPSLHPCTRQHSKW